MSGKGVKSTASIAENAALAKEKRGFPFKKVFFALLITLIVLSIFVLIINIVINSYFSKVKVFDGVWEIDKEKLESKPIYQDNFAYFAKSEELHAAYDAALLNYAQAMSDMRYDEGVYNYALFGVDQFEGSEIEPSADIIMLVSVNEEDDHVTYLSFETKMLVYIPSVGVGPMSDAYVLGGPQLLANTIEENYGIKLDGFVEINMTAFTELIQVFGDIEIDGNAALVERINNDILLFNEAKGLEGDDVVKPVKLEKDKIFLEGEQTLAYLRNAGDDKSNIANEIMSQLSSKIHENGFGGVITTLDISLERMMVSMVRDDVGALISIGYSVFESIKTTPVGNMEGRGKLVPGYTCDYAAERAAVIKALY